MQPFSVNEVFFVLLVCLVFVDPIQLQQENEDSKENNIEPNEFNKCLSGQKSTDLGYCFGREVLTRLNDFNEADSFSLATGVDFVRDEKTPRDFGSFLDKDPLDFRSIMDDASNLISKRSLRWDLSTIYPGLTMRIGPTLANGILEFVMDPRLKDRTYQQQQHGELSTGRLLARNLLVPFLLGFKFQLSTLLPILLGLILLASKKAFLLSKVALLAATVFGSGSNGYGSNTNTGYFSDFSGPTLSSYTSSFDHPTLLHGHHHGHGSGGGYYHNRHPPHHADYLYREKSAETTAIPITPHELRDRLERLFITKQNEEPREDVKVRNARNFAWTPINNG